MKPSRRQTLLKEYGEVGQMFRKLTDIRFRLLSFLPLATGVGAAVTVLRNDITTPGAAGFAAFGLVVTSGLLVYSARNDQLYDELVGRAAAIERAVGLHDGQFANRPRAWLKVQLLGRNWKIEHGTALWLIYGAAMTLWLSLLIMPVLGWMNREYGEFARTHGYLRLPVLTVVDPASGVVLAAIAVAASCVYIAGRKIDTQLEKRRDFLREHAARAYTRALSLGGIAALGDSEFIGECVKLRGNVKKTYERAQFYKRLDAETLRLYWPVDESRKMCAALLVALLTDVPPRWVFECGEGKHGELFEGHLSNGAPGGVNRAF